MARDTVSTHHRAARFCARVGPAAFHCHWCALLPPHISAYLVRMLSWKKGVGPPTQTHHLLISTTRARATTVNLFTPGVVSREHFRCVAGPP